MHTAWHEAPICQERWQTICLSALEVGGGALLPGQLESPVSGFFLSVLKGAGICGPLRFAKDIHYNIVYLGSCWVGGFGKALRAPLNVRLCSTDVFAERALSSSINEHTAKVLNVKSHCASPGPMLPASRRHGIVLAGSFVHLRMTTRCSNPAAARCQGVGHF